MSVNDFVVRAVALALAEVPEANAIWDPEAQEPKIVDSVDVAIAVATDKGLITPIVKAANTKSLAQVMHSYLAYLDTNCANPEKCRQSFSIAKTTG